MNDLPNCTNDFYFYEGDPLAWSKVSFSVRAEAGQSSDTRKELTDSGGK